MSRTGAETCDVFEVVFYPALAPHGGDDSGGVLRSERVKERVKRIVSRAPRDERVERVRSSRGGKGTTEPSACDPGIAREEVKSKGNKKREWKTDRGRTERPREEEFVRRRIDALRETARRLANVRKRGTLVPSVE